MSYGVSAITVALGGHTVLADVTLAIPAGRVTAVVGGDGAGKTTLLRALVGRLACASGSVSAPPAARLGYLPASAGSWRGLSVAENVAFVGGGYGLVGAELAARSEELLAAAGLAQFASRPASALSGGMRRKLGFVLATLHRPDLLVLDEPSTGLDPVSLVDLWRLMASAAAAGAAVVMSTTYLDEAQRASHLLVLDRGRQLVAGRPDELVAGLPGVLTVCDAPVRPLLAWRRGRRFHEWWPDDAPPIGVQVIPADLEDVVVARSLRATGGHQGPATRRAEVQR